MRGSRCPPGAAGQQASQEPWGRGGTGVPCTVSAPGCQERGSGPLRPHKGPGGGGGPLVPGLPSAGQAGQAGRTYMLLSFRSPMASRCAPLGSVGSMRGTGIARHAAAFLSRNVVKTTVQVR